jgi:hypothetical protein
MAEIRWGMLVEFLRADLRVTYLDTATTSETTDSRLGDTLDVISKDLAMTLGSALFVPS